MRNLIRALRGKPVDLSPKQQEKLAKAQAKAQLGPYCGPLED